MTTMNIEFGSMPLLEKVCFHAFSKEIKKQVNEEQNYECDMCHHRVTWMGPHHVVPEKALQGKGIKGRNTRDNAVGLCNGEWGRGTGSPDDHHEIADQKAIRENKFWHNGRFVSLEELDPSTYSGCLRPIQERKTKNYRTKKRRYQHK